MKGNITLLIAVILMLMVFGCKKESDVIVQESQIEYNQITEAYFGDSNELTIKANAANAVTLYIDGKETASGANGSIRYNISNLPVGVHTIKIQFVVGGDTFEKSFKCNIIAMPVIYEIPTLTCTQITESYVGESAVITASTETASKITLFVDGVETQTSDTQTLSFDIQGLNIGTHKIKFVSENGDKKDQKEFDCKILEVVDEYEYVDLGLPSGTLWATCNVGAKNPWEYGDYFAWGEVKPKVDYSWDTYEHSYGPNRIVKYCNGDMYCHRGLNDHLITLEPLDDAATVNLGCEWRMPTTEEMNELFQCDFEYVTNYKGKGVDGIIFRNKSNPNAFMFMPGGVGYKIGSELEHTTMYYAGVEMWTSTCCEQYSQDALSFMLFDGLGNYPLSRICGMPIRAVRCKTPVKNLYLKYVTKAHLGERVIITANTIEKSNITFYVDGSEKKQISDVQTLDYNVSELSLGVHQIKVVAINNGNREEQNFEIEIIDFTYVDLGLPSGTLWAACNVGALNPWDYGDYFAWGETEPQRRMYDWSTYKYCNGNQESITKYNTADNLSVLDLSDDAATMNMGSDWRMPTMEEFRELTDYCDFSYVNDYNGTGINGVIVRSKTTDSFLFFPKGGEMYEGRLWNFNSNIEYWTSTGRAGKFAQTFSSSVFFTMDYSSSERCNGLNVRAVRKNN